MINSSGLRIKQKKTEIIEKMVKGGKIYKDTKWVICWGKQEDEVKKVGGGRKWKEKGCDLSLE